MSSFPKERKVLSIDTCMNDDEPTLPGFPMESKENKDTQMSDIPEKKDELKTPIICQECGTTIPEATDRACRKCGYYRPQPGETFDVSKVFWRPPAIMHQEMKVRRVDEPHEIPFPGGIGSGDAVSSHECQEWTLNHLPLTEEQKKQLVTDLAMEKFDERKKEVVEEVGKRRRQTKKEMVKEGWRRKQQIKTEILTGQKQGDSAFKIRHSVKEPTRFTPSS